MSGSQQPANVRTFHATGMHDLPALTQFVDASCARVGASDDDAFALRLAVEEAFANIVRHGYDDCPGPVDLQVNADRQQIIITLTDQAPLFDPSEVPEPDIEAPIEQREPGGMGLHLIRRMVDTMSHQAGRSGGNVTTLVKRLKPSQQNIEEGKRSEH